MPAALLGDCTGRRFALTGLIVPARRPSLPPGLSEILFSEAAIRRRVARLAREIEDAYRGESLTAIAIVNGAILFAADLLRQISLPVRLDCIRVKSYGKNRTSRGRPRILQSLTLDLAGQHVLVIDDILDTGKTMALVTQTIRRRRPASVRTCVLLDKPSRRAIPFKADFVGFTVPDRFVVGYGMDDAERFRNLRCIGVPKG